MKRPDAAVPAGFEAPSHGGRGRLRVVVYTAGPLLPVDRVLFRRLASDPLLDLRAIIVDEFERPRTSLAFRIIQGARTEGWRWLLFKIGARWRSLVRKLVLGTFELVHPRREAEESYDALGRTTGIRIHRVADINDDGSVALIQSLRPELGVIVGGRILREAIISAPERGTLNLCKRRLPDHRGGGPVGYWEVLGGEPTIGVTVHYAVREVDAGPILAQETIPIEPCDTLSSLRLKAEIRGAQLYHDAIRRVALGDCAGKPQDGPGRLPSRSPSDLSVHQLEERLQRRAARTMPTMRARPSRATRVQLFVQYAILLPWLLFLRHRFVRRARAPICIFFYHVAATRPVNHMCLPLEEFVRQVEFLQRYYEVIALDQAVARLRSGRNEKIAASITFDDGYRDNYWAVEYLRYFGIPASFFVSIGHVRDGSAFAHDRRAGFEDARPLREVEVRRLIDANFLVGSHAMHHEDFGRLDAATAEHVLRESRQLIGQICGRVPEHFAFPIGRRGRNITRETFALAQTYYRYVYSAYGGYNFPVSDRTHFLRIANPFDLDELVRIMDGYTAFRHVLSGNAWGLKTHTALPY